MKHSDKYVKSCIILWCNIKKIRESKNLSIIEVSKMTGISIGYLKRIEKGDAPGVMILRHLVKITVVLGVKLYELMEGV